MASGFARGIITAPCPYLEAYSCFAWERSSSSLRRFYLFGLEYRSPPTNKTSTSVRTTAEGIQPRIAPARLQVLIQNAHEAKKAAIDTAIERQ
jgi:hypothetical protein